MTIVQANCLDFLPTIEKNTMQLIYIDPPFFTQKNHSLKTRDNQKEYGFSDYWHSLTEYLVFMKKVLIQCHRILNDTGSIFLHCDKSASHHLRILLDEVFGEKNFQSEIIWSYKRWSNSKKGLLNTHQNIYFYSKTVDFKFNPLYTDYSPTTNIDQILQSRERNEFGKATYQRDEHGDIVLGKEKIGVPLSDVWNIPFLNPKAKERVGYPTQKPILLLERMILIASDERDRVLDPFCGSGTTLVAAKLLNREYLGIDISLDAVNLAKSRLLEPIKTESNLLKLGAESYRQKTEYERNILRSIDAIPVERNKGIDGFLKVHINGSPVAVRIQKPQEDIETAKEQLMIASQAKKCSLMILVRTHSQQERLFPSLLDDSNVIILDAYDFILDSHLKSHRDSKSPK
jgi:site-specific DNA-methyltransferase (adenine-specific)